MPIPKLHEPTTSAKPVTLSNVSAKTDTVTVSTEKTTRRWEVNPIAIEENKSWVLNIKMIQNPGLVQRPSFFYQWDCFIQI